VAPGKVAQAVLAHLVLAGGRTVSVRGLSADVWDNPPDSARNAVQVAVSKLRRAYGADFLLSDQTGYRLPRSGLRVDLVEYDALVGKAGDHLAAKRPTEAIACVVEAEALMTAEPLAGLESAQSDSARRSIEDRGSAARLLRGRALLDLGRTGEALVLLQNEVARDGFAEPAHALLMKALQQAGRPGDALTVYETLRTRLADELGADPSPQVAAVFADLLESSTPVARAHSSAPPRQLPAYASPLLGRAADLERIVSSFARGTRLLTLLGPGGIGKTRLAVAAARRMAGDAGSAVYFIDLTTAHHVADIRAAAAAALRVPVERVMSLLGASDALVVLDNAEHMVDAVAEAVPELLASDGVRLLITSQSPLRLREEQQVWIGALSSDLPDRPAVALLADRANLSEADRAEQMGDLVALARCADGMPLVLELLATSLRWESAASLRSRLAEALPGLQDDARDRPTRHLSLRAAISWSLSQAGRDARTVLGACMVFSGSFGADAASAVLAPALPVQDISKPIAELVELSLVQRLYSRGEIRYHVLEPIRMCAAESEQVPPPSHVVHRAHAAHYLRWLDRPVPKDDSSQLDDQQLVRESEANLRVALEWLWKEDPEAALVAVRPLLGIR
jgi:predicted ATPase/DNA-binding SARP family transcriptional activator